MAEGEDLSMWMKQNRLSVVVGHCGSGKTEVSLNLVRDLRKREDRVALADLDIVNPYFRSRERKTFLDAQGIRLITSSQACADADIPSMPAELAVLFDDKSIKGVLDVGGDASGARVLARYRRQLKACSASVLCVVNANRPLSDTPEKVEQYIRSIEATSGLSIDGIINNTHLCGETEWSDVLRGAELVQRVSEETDIPVFFHTYPIALLEVNRAPENIPLFPIEIYMKKPWE